MRQGVDVEVRLQHALDIGSVLEVFGERVYMPLHRSLSPAATVIDVGSSIGDFVVSLRNSDVAQVLAVDPDASVAPMFRRNVENNGMADRVTLINAVVGTGSWDVPSVTLDELFERFGVERCALLKVDCEGGEYELFRCASSGILARVDYIVMECHRRAGDEFERMSDRLKGEGFQIRGGEWNVHNVRLLHAWR
jgi:hypothetical protein